MRKNERIVLPRIDVHGQVDRFFVIRADKANWLANGQKTGLTRLDQEMFNMLLQILHKRTRGFPLTPGEQKAMEAIESELES